MIIKVEYKDVPALFAVLPAITSEILNGFHNPYIIREALSRIRLQKPEKCDRDNHIISFSTDDPYVAAALLSRVDAIEVPEIVGNTTWNAFVFQWDQMLHRIGAKALNSQLATAA